MDRRDKSGRSKREHLEQVEKATGKRPADLESPPFPDELAHIWAYFLDLSSARSSGGMGPGPITYTEIASWSNMTATPITPAEVRAVKRLDALWLRVISEERS